MDKFITDKVNQYYTTKIIENGPSSNGVDWSSIESHHLRFDQLTKVFLLDKHFSILDFGCGYGALVDYLRKNNFQNFKYFGYDISPEMVKVAKQKFSNDNYVFATELNQFQNWEFDYCIANGIFNVRLDISDSNWKEYILNTLNDINRLSKKGFAFNILTKYSDVEYMKDYLYYADPLFLFDYCKTNFSKYISLIHDYPLYEFSIIVKK
jgi:SAM-dependent methyltransferase